MPKCITCGAELHPERARKYDYCMSRDCQEKNARGLTMVAVGVNKSAEQYFILDEQTEAELASGKYHDQRRGSFGTSATTPPSSGPRRAKPSRQARGTTRPAPHAAARKQWTGRQERLALLYNEQGLPPARIAEKLGLSSYLVTQIILSSRNRGKL
jgi:hypothetical protein